MFTEDIDHPRSDFGKCTSGFYGFPQVFHNCFEYRCFVKTFDVGCPGQVFGAVQANFKVLQQLLTVLGIALSNLTKATL